MKTLERIMLVDDDLDTNFYNKIVLEQAKATNEIIVFENGKEALEYLKNGSDKVDLILLDINMPIMTGWQFLEHYERLDENRKATIVIVMLTSSINSDDRKKADKFSSIKKFINKPISPGIINEILDIFG